MPEICGEAAMYFDPGDTSDIADTLVRFVTDHDARDRLAEAALERAERYSWERAARETHGLFREVLEADTTRSTTSQPDGHQESIQS